MNLRNAPELSTAPLPTAKLAAAVLAAVASGCHLVANLDDIRINENATTSGVGATGGGGSGGIAGHGGTGAQGGGGTGGSGGEAPPLSHVWSGQFGDANSQVAHGIAVDPTTGGPVLVGTFDGNLDPQAGGGGGILTSAGDDVFVLARSSDGAHRWARAFGDSTEVQHGADIAIHASDFAVIAGHTDSAFEIDSEPIAMPQGRAGFAARLPLSGSPANWGLTLDAAGNQAGQAIAVDNSGYVYVAGRMDGAGLDSINPACTGLLANGPNDLFIMQLDADGSCQRHVALGMGSINVDVTLGGIATDSAGAVLVAGAFLTAIRFDTVDYPSAGGTDGFVAKFDHDLQPLWFSHLAGPGDDAATAVAVDANDDVVVTGYFYESIDIGGDIYTAAGTTASDLFVAKLNGSTRERVWGSPYGGDSSEEGTSIATAPDHVVVAGSYTGNGLDLGGGALAHQGGDDIFVAVFDGGGDHLASRGYGGTGNDRCHDIALDGADYLWLTGEFHDGLTFGGQDLTSAGDADIFLAKLRL